jgi:hypothetical protein
MDQPGVVEVKVSECVLDMALYPRHCVDQGNVQSLREALRAEAKFPPIVLERKTMRIVDGASRLTATREEQGDEALIRAYLRDYPSEAALLSEAIQLNASHGRRLTTYDRARCIQLARELGLTDAEVAKSLRITVEKVEQIVNTRFTMGPDDKVVPIKLTSAPVLAGRQATPHQLVANKGAGGMPVGFYVSQLLNAIGGELVDWSNADLVDRLLRLHAVLGDALDGRGEQKAA